MGGADCEYAGRAVDTACDVVFIWCGGFVFIGDEILGVGCRLLRVVFHGGNMLGGGIGCLAEQREIGFYTLYTQIGQMFCSLMRGSSWMSFSPGILNE